MNQQVTSTYSQQPIQRGGTEDTKELASLSPETLRELIDNMLLQNMQLTKLVNNETDQSSVNEIKKVIEQNKTNLTLLNDALIAPHIERCIYGTPLQQSEAFAKLAHLTLTERQISQECVISTDFFVFSNYSSKKFTSIAENKLLSDQNKGQHGKTNLKLAQQHHALATTLKEQGASGSFHFFQEGSYQYHLTFAIAHYEMASNFGNAAASFELANIYMYGQSVDALPLEYQQGARSTHEIALDYAVTAINQGDQNALSNLANNMLKDKIRPIYLIEFNVVDCYKKALYLNLTKELQKISQTMEEIEILREEFFAEERRKEFESFQGFPAQTKQVENCSIQ